jgi:hypothetical protein
MCDDCGCKEKEEEVKKKVCKCEDGCDCEDGECECSDEGCECEEGCC